MDPKRGKSFLEADFLEVTDRLLHCQSSIEAPRGISKELRFVDPIGQSSRSLTFIVEQSKYYSQ